MGEGWCGGAWEVLEKARREGCCVCEGRQVVKNQSHPARKGRHEKKNPASPKGKAQAGDESEQNRDRPSAASHLSSRCLSQRAAMLPKPAPMFMWGRWRVGVGGEEKPCPPKAITTNQVGR